MDPLVAYSCTRCGHRTYPRHSRCPKCRNGDFVDVKLSEGKVLTHTTLTATRPGFAKPLVLAIVDFDGLRILGQLTSSEPRVDMKVRPEIGGLSDSDGARSIGIRFVPK